MSQQEVKHFRTLEQSNGFQSYWTHKGFVASSSIQTAQFRQLLMLSIIFKAVDVPVIGRGGANKHSSSKAISRCMLVLSS